MGIDRALALVGILITIVIVVLDKAGVLKGAFLVWLLVLCAIITLPLSLNVPWIYRASSSSELLIRRILLFFLTGSAYSLIAVIIVRSPTFKSGPEAARVQAPHVETELPHAKTQAASARVEQPLNTRQRIEPPKTMTKPRERSTDDKAPELRPMTQSNSGGIAIGRDNNGTAIVNNYEKPVPAKRVVSMAASSTAVQILRSAPEQSRIKVTIVGSSDEVHDFAAQVIDIFRHSGWLVEVMMAQNFTDSYISASGHGMTLRGEGITCYNYSSSDPAASAARQAVAALGFPYKERHFSEEDEIKSRRQAIELVIGTRMISPPED